MSEDAFRWVITAAVILACLAFVAQAGIAFALLRVARKLQNKVEPLADRAEPILETTHKILEENRPRISEISIQAVEVAKSARAQADRLGELLEETADRARVRLAQIDQSVGEAVGQVENMGGAVKTAVLKPVKEVNGIMAAMKAAVAAYVNAGRRAAIEHATQDEEMFI